MPHKAKRIERLFRLTVILLFLQLSSVTSQAQNIMHLDSLNMLKYPGYIIDYTQKGIKYTDEVIEKYLDERDTRFKTPNLYKWQFMLQYSNYYEYYQNTNCNTVA